MVSGSCLTAPALCPINRPLGLATCEGQLGSISLAVLSYHVQIRPPDFTRVGNVINVSVNHRLSLEECNVAIEDVSAVVGHESRRGRRRTSS
jgi:hypothetical protein